MAIPPDLMSAVALQNGRISIVIGAGCSLETPTNLKLSKYYSLEAHKALRANSTLSKDCEAPEDLSAVADAVIKERGTQISLVQELPIEDFRQALPNEGHLIAAAMLREGVINSIITLNFDLAMTKALSDLSAKNVAVLKGPEEHNRASNQNLIYLNRNVEALPADWVLTSDALEKGWKDSWGQVITLRALSCPFIVFSGLGSPAGVLSHTTKWIQESLPEGQTEVYLVDPDGSKSSRFYKDMSINEDHYIQLGWCDFMRRLSQRLLNKHVDILKNAFHDAVEAYAYTGLEEDSYCGVCDRIYTLGLIKTGRMRARLFLRKEQYSPLSDEDVLWIADLILAVTLIEEETGWSLEFGSDGTLVITNSAGQLIACVVVAHARGRGSWNAIQHKLETQCEHILGERYQPSIAIISGVEGDRPQIISPPDDITGEIEEGSILSTLSTLIFVSTIEIRNNRANIRELLRLDIEE